MTSEHLLDAIGLLDDKLIREAEDYTVQKRRVDHRKWIGLVASFAVVLALGYGVTHIGMGGGGALTSGGGAAGAPSASNSLAQGSPSTDHNGTMAPSGEESQGAAIESPGSGASGGISMDVPDAVAPTAPPEYASGEEDLNSDRLLALKVDGTVYWATEEYIQLDPEESDIRYTTSYIDSAEPEEDGQANFLPVGLAYVMLEDGTVAVRHDGDGGSWRIFDPVPPWERP